MELQCGAGQFAVTVRRAHDTVGHGRSKSGGSNTNISRIEIIGVHVLRLAVYHVSLLKISPTEPLRACRKLVPAKRAIPCGSSFAPAAERSGAVTRPICGKPNGACMPYRSTKRFRKARA